MRLSWITLIASMALAAGAGTAPPPSPTSSATAPPPTATVAFPTLRPTSTYTPMPTGSPTPDLPPSPGELVFMDDFSGSLAWTAAELAPGGMSTSQDRLFVSVRQTNGMFIALSPASAPLEAYIQVDVQGEVCSENDEFGLIFRVNERFDHYRFTLTCQGQARVVGIVEGSERVLVPDTASLAILPGPLLSNRLAVELRGGEFRFFVNGELLFSDRDLSLADGGIGLVVRARKSGQTTASFDNFQVRRLLLDGSATPTD